MSQTSYDINQAEAYAGMKVDSRFDTVESKLAEVPSGSGIAFGLGLMSGNDDAVNQVRKPSKTKSILSIDADLITANSTIATVNGNDTPAVVFATDHATTMAALAVAIAALDGVLSAVVSAARDITIIGENGVAIDASAVTTLGASQGTWTQVQSDPGVFRGVAVHRHVSKALSTGVAQYEDTDAVDVLRVGEIWMPYVAAATPAADDALYVNLAVAGEEGKATNVSSNNIAVPGGKIREVNTTLKLLKANINLPQ